MRFSEFDFLIEAPRRTPRPGLRRQPTQQAPQQAPQQQAPQAPQQQAAQAQQQVMQYSLHGGGQPDATDAANINSWADAIQSGAHSPNDVPDVYQQFVTQVINDRGLTAPERRKGPVNRQVDKRADQIFINNFATKLRNAKSDPQFDYDKFTQEYLGRNRYNPGVYKLQLDSAIKGKNDLALG